MRPLKGLNGSFINSTTNSFLQDAIERGIIILEQQMILWETCCHLSLDWAGLNWMWLIKKQWRCHCWNFCILPNDVWKVWFTSPKILGRVDIDCIIPFRYSCRRQQIWNIERSLLGFILESLVLHIKVMHQSPTDFCLSELAPDWIVIAYNTQSNLQALERPD